MSKAMTCRFNDDMMLQLKEMSEYEHWALPRSKVLRFCVAFTYKHFKKLPKKKADQWAGLQCDMNRNFKTDVHRHDLQD